MIGPWDHPLSLLLLRLLILIRTNTNTNTYTNTITITITHPPPKKKVWSYPNGFTLINYNTSSGVQITCLDLGITPPKVWLYPDVLAGSRAFRRP